MSVRNFGEDRWCVRDVFASGHWCRCWKDADVFSFKHRTLVSGCCIEFIRAESAESHEVWQALATFATCLARSTYTSEAKGAVGLVGSHPCCWRYAYRTNGKPARASRSGH